jgi:ABC-type multidrug transport system fused ATPase/permease subunit
MAKLLNALRGLIGTLTMVVAAHGLSTVTGCDQLIDLRSAVGIMTEATK